MCAAAQAVRSEGPRQARVPSRPRPPTREAGLQWHSWGDSWRGGSVSLLFKWPTLIGEGVNPSPMKRKITRLYNSKRFTTCHMVSDIFFLATLQSALVFKETLRFRGTR